MGGVVILSQEKSHSKLIVSTELCLETQMKSFVVGVFCGVFFKPKRAYSPKNSIS